MTKTQKKSMSLLGILIAAVFLIAGAGFVPAIFGARAAPSEDYIDSQRRYTIIDPHASVDWAGANRVRSALHTHASSSGIIWNDSGLPSSDELITAYENAGFGALVLTDHDWVGYPWNGRRDLPWANGNDLNPAMPMPRPHVNSPNSPLLTIPGNELSNHTHTLAFGVIYHDNWICPSEMPSDPDARNAANRGRTAGMEASIRNVGLTPNVVTGGTGGLIYFAHPRRNNRTEDRRDMPVTTRYSDAWWAAWVEEFDHVRGMEVLNAGQFSDNHSERLWDSILTRTMPHRPVWGIASDDNHGSLGMHASSNLGTGYTNLLLNDDELNDLGLYNALKNGNMYFSTHMLYHDILGGAACTCCRTSGHTIDNRHHCWDDRLERPRGWHGGGIASPSIKSITVCNDAGTITVVSTRTARAEWISGTTYYENQPNRISRVVAAHNNPAPNAGRCEETYFVSVLNVEDVRAKDGGRANYVRVRLIGDGGQSHAQPFGLVTEYVPLHAEGDIYTINFGAETIAFESGVEFARDRDFSTLLNSGDRIYPGTQVFARYVPEHVLLGQERVVREVNIPNRPEAPQVLLSARGRNAITLGFMPNAQYRIADGEWQDSPVFDELESDTEYRFEIRRVSGDRFFESAIGYAYFRTREAAVQAAESESNAERVYIFGELAECIDDVTIGSPSRARDDDGCASYSVMAGIMLAMGVALAAVFVSKKI